MLKVRCHEDEEVHIPLQLYAALKLVQGRNVKATGPRWRQRRLGQLQQHSPPAAAAASSSGSNDDAEREELALLRRGYLAKTEAKVLRMTREMRRIKLQEFRLRGLI